MPAGLPGGKIEHAILHPCDLSESAATANTEQPILQENNQLAEKDNFLILTRAEMKEVTLCMEEASNLSH